MNIGIFAASVGRQYGGPETYERCLVRAIAGARSDHEFRVYCFGPHGRALIGLQGSGRVHVHQLWPASRWVALPVSLPLSLMVHRPDLCHATFIPPPACPVRLVFTMHDVSMFAFPEYYGAAVHKRLTPLIRKGLQRAALVICVSENARQTTAEHVGIPLERMTVVHHGVAPGLRPVPAEEAREALGRAHRLTGPFLLYVGKLQVRKNVVRMLEAFARFRHEARSGHKFVLAGRRLYDTSPIDEAIDRLGLRGHVVELGYVADADMPALYSAADALVYTTLWEGFGFPVVEAMACGTPVVTSTVSSLPEVAGDAALLVDPTSVDEIAQAMLRLHNDPALAAALREKGRVRAAHFTWERAARETIAAYERASNA